jgi:hypothetical protein
MADQAIKEFMPRPQSTWIELFMKNNNYSIRDNEGGGDCFFAVVRDAFAQIGKDTTVAKLRTMVMENTKQETFEEYRTLYTMFSNEIQDIDRQIADTKETIQRFKTRLTSSRIGKEKISETDGAKSKKEENKEILQHIQDSQTLLKKLATDKHTTTQNLNEFKFMKGVNTFEKFKSAMLTSEYWADQHVIHILEELLHSKFVILSESAFYAGDIDSVLQCGEMREHVLKNQSTYSPEFYILTAHTGNHYKLILYKNKAIFSYTELPYTLKTLVINKCMESNAGAYPMIKEFRDFKSSLGLPVDTEEDDTDELVSEMDLYDDSIVFSIHSKSDSTPKAGKGNGETIPSSLVPNFSALSRIPDWRRKLDDAWIAPFTHDGRRWSSVEHYYQASKFKKGNPDFYASFALTEGTDPDVESIATSVALAKAAGGIKGKLGDTVLRKASIMIDPDFYNVARPRSVEEQRVALFAKFSQNRDLLDILLKTDRAKIVQFVRRKPPIVDTPLMKLRSDLASKRESV